MHLFICNNRSLRHKGTVVLETERFVLRQFQLKDVHDVFVNWASDMDSAKYNAWNVHENENETNMYVSEWIDNYKKNNYYHWAIVDKDDEEVIGSISVSNIKNRKNYCEIGYTVAKKRWNEGIATEVLIYVIEFLTIDVGFEKLHAMHDVRNMASGRVMEKAGMFFVKNQRRMFLGGQNFIMNCSVYEYKK